MWSHAYIPILKSPPSTPRLLELCTSLFQKIPTSPFIPTSMFIREMRVSVWTIQPTELITCLHFFRIFLQLYMLLVLCNKSMECSDHGTCDDDGKCLCHDGYFGTECSSKLIFLEIKTYLYINYYKNY